MAAADIADQRVSGAGSPDDDLPVVMISMPFPATGKGVSYTCGSIARNIGKMALRVELFAPYGTEKSAGRYRMTQTLPLPLRVLPFSKTRNFAARRNEAALLKAAKRQRRSTIAYVWPDAPLGDARLPSPLLKALRDEGIPIVREMINSHVAQAKTVLDAEYLRLGLPPGHAITEAFVERENATLALCDYIFCSNPLAEKSVIEIGVPPDKVRSVSFGWDPERFEGEGRALAPIDGTTFLYAGLICVRKGAHLILRYWAESGIRGRLVMVGAMEPAIEKVCAEYLRRDDVTIVSHTPKISDYYRSADAFVFPTLEEGGPQVTYEAAGCGLPLIVSPMGAARIADASTGFVVDPFDQPGWTESMRALAKDAALRRRMGAHARREAGKFTWPEVSRARGEVFEEIGRTWRRGAKS